MTDPTLPPGTKVVPLMLRPEQLDALLQHYLFLLAGAETALQEYEAADSASDEKAREHEARVGAHVAMMVAHPQAEKARAVTLPLLEQMLPMVAKVTLAEVLEHHRMLFTKHANAAMEELAKERAAPKGEVH